ncbi:unnamed protein product [Urochloa decumbens]|uniref:KIB1-4 beta-propeller domain-containing protein n=1 Tax=Urochloa decumbens TaxID=240449 RepID=A0ABC8XX13_9POAL
MGEMRKKLEERDWSGLPPDVASLFAGRLRCNVDRANMQLQCRRWHATVSQLPECTQLPWMLVPSRRSFLPQNSILSKAQFFCFLSGRSHFFPIPLHAHRARFVGSTEGGWVVVATHHSTGYIMVNFRTERVIRLPESIIPHSDSFVLRACAFSCAPSLAGNCLVASIVSIFDCSLNYTTHVAFSRLGASYLGCASEEVDAEDIIYFGGAFYCLTGLEDLLRFTPHFNRSDPVEDLAVSTTMNHFHPARHDDSFCVKGRYLVESRGELLMVARYKNHSSDDTSSFGLFRMVPDDHRADLFRWESLAFEDRLIFVGRGCSRCYESNLYPECREGVYFVDDDTFGQAAMVGYGFSNGRAYSAHDNGFWPGPGSEVIRSFDGRLPSAYSPPIWFLH